MCDLHTFTPKWGILLFLVTQESGIAEALSSCIYHRLLKKEEEIWGNYIPALKASIQE